MGVGTEGLGEKESEIVRDRKKGEYWSNGERARDRGRERSETE